MPKKQRHAIERCSAIEIVDQKILQKTSKFKNNAGNCDAPPLLKQIYNELCQDALSLADLSKKIKQFKLEIQQNHDMPDDAVSCLCDIFIALKYSCAAKAAIKSCLQKLDPNILTKVLSRQILYYINEDHGDKAIITIVETVQSCFDNFNVGKAALELILPDVLNFLHNVMSKCIEQNKKWSNHDLKFINFLTKCLCAVIQLCRTNSTVGYDDCFIDMEKTCNKILLKDAFIGDCCQTAGLLKALLMISLNSSNEPEQLTTHIYRTNDFNDAEIKSEYAKLSLLNGVMSVADLQILLQENTEVKSNLLCGGIFHELKILQTTVKDSLTTVMLARTLVQFSLLLCKANIQASEVKPIADFLLHYSMINLDHSQDAVNRQARSVLQNTLKVMLKQNEDAAVEILQTISVDNWHKRSTLHLIANVLDHCQVDTLTKHIPNLKDKLLNVMCDQTLVPYACDVYKKMAKKSMDSVPEVSSSCLSEYLNPVLHKMAGVNAKYATLMVEYLLISLLKLYRTCDCINYIIRYYNRNAASQQLDNSDLCGSFVALMMCLRTAHNAGLNITNADGDMLTNQTMQQALLHHEDKVRLMAFSLLCESPKTTAIVSKHHIYLIQFALPFNCNNQCPAFRQQFIGCIKKLIERIYLNVTSILKKNKGNSEVISTQREFLEFLLLFCKTSLHQDNPYGKRITVLSLFNGLFVATTSNNLNLLPLESFITEETTTTLCKLLKDNYDDVVQTAFELLTSAQVKHIVCQHMNADLSIQSSLDIAQQSKKPEHCRHAAYQLKLLAHLSQRSNVEVYISLMKDILTSLSEDMLVAKASIYDAAMKSPFYGSLHCIRSLFQALLSTPRSAEQNTALRRTVVDIISCCLSISKLVLPVVGSVSPEGHLPDMEDDQTNGWQNMTEDMKKFFLHDENESNNRVVAQRLLVCCWRSAKETSLLLQEVTSQSVMLDSSPDVNDGLISWKQLLVVGEHLKCQLMESRHRGAFELAFAAFKNFVPRLWNSNHDSLSKLPLDWLMEMLSVVRDPIKSLSLCSTRRSAGLPFFIQALVSDKCKKCRQHLPTVMEQLIDLCEGENQMNTTSKIHALNILRALVRDATLSGDMSQYLSKCTQLAIEGFGASVWDIRNASTLLFAALFNKIFGVKRDKDADMSPKNRLSSYRFFSILPGIETFLYNKLIFICNEMEKGFTIQPLLHPILLMFSNVHSSSINQSSLDPFIELFIRCGITSVYKSRVVSAKALSSVLTHDQVSTTLIRLCEVCKDNNLSQNHIHAILLQINRILETRMLPGKFSDVTIHEVYDHLLGMLKLSKKCDKCAITKTELLRMYLNTLKLSKDVYDGKEIHLTDMPWIQESIEIWSEDGSNELVIGSSMLWKIIADVLFYQNMLGSSDTKFQSGIFINIYEKNKNSNVRHEILKNSNLNWNTISNLMTFQDFEKLHKFFCLELLNTEDDTTTQEILLNLLGEMECPCDVDLLKMLRKICNNKSSSSTAIKCMGRAIPNIKSSDDKIFNDEFVVEYLNEVQRMSNPVTMTTDERITAASSFSFAASHILFSNNEIGKTGFALAWNIYINFLLDEDEDVRKTACKLTRQLVLESKLMSTSHANVDIFAIRQAICLLMVTMATERPDDCKEILLNLQKEAERMKSQNKVQSVGDECATSCPALFDRSQLNTYYDAIMMNELCENAQNILQLSQSSGFRHVLLSKLNIIML